MKRRIKLKSGLTLVELIVVIAVLAVLAVFAVVAIAGIQRNARRARLIADATMLIDAINLINTNLPASDRITSTAGINAAPAGAGGSVNITVTSGAVPGVFSIGVIFPSQERFDMIVGEDVIMYAAVADEPGTWRIDYDVLDSVV